MTGSAMHLELRQLRYFVAVADEMHFGRAALKLNMTQPPLSQAIQALEENLGTALFIRNTRKIALSAAGAALLPEARRILQQTAALPALAQRAASGHIGQIKIAFVSIADYSVLPPFLRHFHEQQPDVQLSLKEATSDIQLALLHAGEIDVGFLIPPIPGSLATTLHYRKLLSEPLVLATPSNWQRLHPQKLSSYKESPLILFPRTIAPALHDLILGCFRQQGLTPTIGQEAIQMQTIIALVSAGMGIALVPQSVSNLQRPGVIYHALPDLSARVEIGVAWRQDTTSPALVQFLKLLQPG
jgi:DNA-binding transcriptional LysR family regulator